MTQDFGRLKSGFGRDDFRATGPVTVKPIPRAVSRQCGFGEQIHWFRVNGRSIHVKWYAVPKNPDSCERNL